VWIEEDMKQFEIRTIDKSIAKRLIIKHHYSHKWSSCKYALGLILDNKIKGVAIFGHPIGRQVTKSITSLPLEQGAVLELTRLWVSDKEGKNTESYFLGKCFQWLKNNTRTKILVSYSDPCAGHVGFIYQATNWWYQGNSITLIKGYIHIVNGHELHPRTCVAKFKTIKTEELRKIDPNYKRILMPKKHRYIYIIHKKDRDKFLKTLKHPLLPYPKNNDSCIWKEKKEKNEKK
jgi:hypothetical protein